MPVERFRFIPQIVQTGIEKVIGRKAVALLSDRDRRLEDYLTQTRVEANHSHTAPPSPSGTVVGETAYGQSSSAGASALYSRGDHTHGTPVMNAGVITGALGYTPANRAGDTFTGTVTVAFPHNLVARAGLIVDGDMDIAGSIFQAGLPGSVSFEAQGTFIQGGQTFVVGNLNLTNAGAVRADALEGANAGSAAQTRMHSGNKLSTSWDAGGLRFYVDDTLVRTL